MIIINDKLNIAEAELEFSAACSGGPGGQNVNKVATRVLLQFDVAHSPSLSPWQRQRLLSRLGSRINKEGVLRVVCQESRSQVDNRERVMERFAELLREALKYTPPRIKTRPTFSSKRRRLDEKKHQSRIKQSRRQPPNDE
jgi:ribosome-associated protein